MQTKSPDACEVISVLPDVPVCRCRVHGLRNDDPVTADLPDIWHFDERDWIQVEHYLREGGCEDACPERFVRSVLNYYQYITRNRNDLSDISQILSTVPARELEKAL